MPNTHPDHKSTQARLESAKQIVGKSKETESDTTTGFGTEPEGKIIDCVFYRYASPVSYGIIIGDYGIPSVSDHYPITRTFKY